MAHSNSSRRAGRRPSPSLVISVLALFVALGGTATAASVLIRSSSQIRNGVVTGADLKNGTVAARDLRNGSVTLDKLQGSTRTAIQNAATEAREAFRASGPNGISAGGSSRVATLAAVPPGVYAIIAKTVLTAQVPKPDLLSPGESVSGHCVLDAAGDQDESRALLGGPGANSPGEVNMQITRTLSSTADIALDCDVQDASWNASNTSIIAIRVGASPRTAVNG